MFRCRVFCRGKSAQEEDQALDDHFGLAMRRGSSYARLRRRGWDIEVFSPENRPEEGGERWVPSLISASLAGEHAGEMGGCPKVLPLSVVFRRVPVWWRFRGEYRGLGDRKSVAAGVVSDRTCCELVTEQAAVPVRTSACSGGRAASSARCRRPWIVGCLDGPAGGGASCRAAVAGSRRLP